MKRFISVLLSLCLIVCLLCAAPITTSAEDTKTVYVGVISYLMNENGIGVTDNVMVHYWGNSADGDAYAFALDPQVTVTRNVGYWNNAQTFTIYRAEIPAAATNYKAHTTTNRWFGDDGDLSKSNIAYIFNYGDDKADYDFYGAYDYYLVGNMNSWYYNESYGLTVNPDDPSEYLIKNVPLTTTSQFKINKPIYNYYYPDGTGNNYGENGEIAEDGTYDIYFRPNGDGGENWFYNVMYVTPAPRFTGHTISLKDEIAVNFYAKFADSTAVTTATYTYGEEGYVKTGTAVKSDTAEADVLKFSVPVNARAMMKPVTLNIYAGEKLVLTGTYSIADYCRDAASTFSTDAGLKNLLCATLNYGGAVQTYFGYNTGELASEKINSIDSGWAPADAPDSLDDTATTITNYEQYNGATMLTTGKTAVRLYFSDSSLVINYNGNQLDLTPSSVAGRGYYVEIPLAGPDIFNNINLTIGGTVYTYNAANYYNYILAKGTTDTVKNVLKAMYQYSDYAKAYTGSNA